jgi:hypothetical protein
MELNESIKSILLKHFQKESNFLRAQGYYLVGGSGLALQLGHRQSIDFDFFSQRKGLAEATQNWLQSFTKVLIRDLDNDTLHAEVDGVKVSFISGYKYRTVAPLIDAKGISIAGLVDIGLMKLLALTHRATLRDYMDLAAILRKHLDLEKLLRAGRQKYGKSFNPMVFLRALVTFTDIDQEMPVLIDKSLKSSWQHVLREAVKKAAK